MILRISGRLKTFLEDATDATFDFHAIDGDEAYVQAKWKGYSAATITFTDSNETTRVAPAEGAFRTHKMTGRVTARVKVTVKDEVPDAPKNIRLEILGFHAVKIATYDVPKMHPRATANNVNVAAVSTERSDAALAALLVNMAI
ncbi:hypothetical protein HGRIS_013948 [Hohenbuehelia grisea]|uniref:Uncharacterized protein n=1 Tax=Hohenbuehelia grisea TaxID=104357 RepID=A0ABR3JS14_9AGAR